MKPYCIIEGGSLQYVSPAPFFWKQANKTFTNKDELEHNVQQTEYQEYEEELHPSE
jgi:hypothetical protein